MTARNVLGDSAGPVRVSSGEMMGMLIHSPQPRCQPPAVAQVQGTVVLHAMVGKDGTLKSLDPISVPPALRDCSMKAVRQWRFRPYLLNGEPREVETTINLNIDFGGGQSTPR